MCQVRLQIVKPYKTTEYETRYRFFSPYSSRVALKKNYTNLSASLVLRGVVCSVWLPKYEVINRMAV